jgi:TonB family protein
MRDVAGRDRALFQCLTDAKTPKGALGLSVGLHGFLLLFLILVPLVAPQALRVTDRTMILVPPPVEPSPGEPPPIRVRPPVSMPKPPSPAPELMAERIPLPAPKPVVREPETRLVEPVPKPAAFELPASVPQPLLTPKPSVVPAPPPPPVITNVFSTAAPAAISAAPARNVEAAGFGDAKSDAGRTAKGEVVASGFGDAAGGRSRGASGRAGTVGAVGGFDSGIQGAREGGSRGTVVASGFSSVAAAPKTPVTAQQKAPEPANEKPVEILMKPRPDYTDEARKVRVEGEVLLRVLFTASGDARVLDVIRGLGYGLNESAIRAAERIRFKPAERGGQPVDSTAVVHIVFQLAY